MYYRMNNEVDKMIKNRKRKITSQMLILNFLAITVGFFIVLIVATLVLSIFDNITNNKTILNVAEYCVVWPLIIGLMFNLLKFVEKGMPNNKLQSNIYMLIPTIEAIVFYGLLVIFEATKGVNKNLYMPLLLVIGIFTLIYIINFIVNSFIKKKK